MSLYAASRNKVLHEAILLEQKLERIWNSRSSEIEMSFSRDL